MTTLRYLGFGFACLYLLVGLYLLGANYIWPSAVTIDNAPIFGGLLVAYGVFRIVRFQSQQRKTDL